MKGEFEMNTPLMFSAKSDDWSTPKDVYDALNKEFMFDYDPCPLQDEDRHALFINWKGRSVFVNPPYSNIANFMEKGIIEIQKGNCDTVVYLVPSRTDTKWWHNFVMRFAREIRFIKGRLKFGDATNSAPFPSVIIVFKRQKNE